MADWLKTDQLIYWLTDWLVSTDWLAGWLTDWLVDWLTEWHWLTDIDLLILPHWLTVCDWPTDWLTDLLASHLVSCWQTDRVDAFLEHAKRCVCVCVCVWVFIGVCVCVCVRVCPLVHLLFMCCSSSLRYKSSPFFSIATILPERKMYKENPLQLFH